MDRSIHTLFWEFCHTLLLNWSAHFPAYYILTNQLGQQFATAKDPKTVCSELHLSLTLTLVAILEVVMGYKKLSNMTLFRQNQWMLKLFAKRRVPKSSSNIPPILLRNWIKAEKEEDFSLLLAPLSLYQMFLF